MPGCIAFGTALLVVHLVLSPLLFSVASLEAFELPKALLLRGAALLLAALACARLLAGQESASPTSCSDTGASSSRARTDSRSRVRDPVVWGVVAFLASGALSTLFSLSPRTSLWGAHPSWSGLVTAIAYAVLFFATRALASGPAAVQALLWGVASAVAGTSVYALVQLAGLDPVPWSEVKRSGDFVRVASTLGNPNFLGAYLAVAFPPCVLLSLRAWRVGRPGAASFLTLLALLAAAVCLATLSRGEWLALAAAAAVISAGFWRLGEGRVIGALAGIAMIFAIAGAAYTATDDGGRMVRAATARVARLADPASEPRSELWRLGWRMAADNPVLGVGPDAFQLAYQRHRSPDSWLFRPGEVPLRAHNGPLHVAATQGTLGLAAASLIALGLALAGGRALRRTDRAQRTTVVVVMAGLAGFAARSLFGFTVVALGTLATSYAAILSRVGYGEDRGPGDSPPPFGPGALSLLLAGAGLTSALLFVANGFGLVDAPRQRVIFVGFSLLAAQGAVALAAWRVETTCQARPIPLPEPGGDEGVERGQPSIDRPESVRPEPAQPGLAQKRPRWPQLVPWIIVAVAFFPLVYQPLAADALGRRGSHFAATGREEAGVVLLEEAVRIQPGAEYLWIELGIAHQRAAAASYGNTRPRAHLERALAAHERASLLVPANATSRANRARSLAELARLQRQPERVREALDAFDEALGMAPREIPILDDATQTAIVLGELERADAYARRWTALYPQHARAWSMAAAVAMARENWQVAEGALETATGADWRGDHVAEAAAWANLATTRLELGRPDDALEAARTAVDRRPTYRNGWRVKARAHSALAAQLLERSRSATSDAARLDLEQQSAAQGVEAEIARTRADPGTSLR